MPINDLYPIKSKPVNLGIIVFEERILVNIRDTNGAVYIFKPIHYHKGQEAILRENFNLTIDLNDDNITLTTPLMG